MALAGTLKDFSLADIFQLIGLQKKTGVLTLKNEKEEARILFMNGLVVGADTNSQKLENRLGHVLVKSNRISQHELEDALASQKNTLQRLGQVLVQKSFIKQEDLRDSLQTQTTQVIYRLFRWIDGEYHFKQERFVDYDQENFAPITSESILMEGIRMLDEWPLIEKVIANFDVMVERTDEGKAVRLNVDNSLSMDVSGEDSFNSLLEGVMLDGTGDEEPRSGPNLSHNMEIVLRLIEGPSEVQDLIDRSGLNEFDTCRALYDLIGMGLVQRLSDEDMETSNMVIEEEQKMPVWIPASMVVVLALFSFYLNWNGLNRYFPLPHNIDKLQSQWDASVNYQLDKIVQAIDLYFIRNEDLPRSLRILAKNDLLTLKDIQDPNNKPFQFDPDHSEGRYTLYGSEQDGRRSTRLVRKKVLSHTLQASE